MRVGSMLSRFSTIDFKSMNMAPKQKDGCPDIKASRPPPKVLIVAENASASFGGEALLPLQYFKFLREMGVDVHLLVHERTQKELYELFPTELDRLHFVRDSLLNIWFWNAGRIMPYFLASFTVGSLSHFDTQFRQRRLARSLVLTHHFNIVHEPIPVSPKLPSLMFGLSVPVVIGPMNGGMDYPPSYNLSASFERLMMFMLRYTSVLWNILLPGKLNAALLLVANKRTFNALPPNLKRKYILELVENGVDLKLFNPTSRGANHENFNVVYIGALIFWKRVDLLIKACAGLLGKMNFKLHIVGDGPERASLEKQSKQLCLTEHVQFHGLLSHSAAAALLRESDIMAHPAMRECGGAVILEAMASGIPVIATAWGGPMDYIDANTGVLIPPATPDVFVSQLTDAILSLAKSPQLREQMGKLARQRVRESYDWRAKAQAMLRIYEDVLSRNSLN